MDLTASGRTWDDASSPAATRLARRYEAAWRSANGRRPDPADFLPTDPVERPGALLALLRTDLTLRWEDRDPAPVESYRERHPELSPDALVALIYEEFCLREEAGDDPDRAEYQARFPEVASQLGRVLDIHGLVGSAQSRSLEAGPTPPVPFPEVGQTIAGFHLVEELGRGAFARVFRAEERLLADRPVALKVARAGSREPQTLARLQHTNIVPVHSYRTDPVTGLHLLCMPYFGRVTLAQVLADPAGRPARTGADLLAVLDRLRPAGDSAPRQTDARTALARRSYAGAIAWWGARMAEALQHAHDRGVLHRDVKPSNVLVTADGMPMLLDFNLARESWADGAECAPNALGGTLAYMAPEQLEALADGEADGGDVRADVYALGVVLFEALAYRPFAVPDGSISLGEAMLRAAEERRVGPPPLRRDHPDVPPALEAVVAKCLAPDPADRYATAGELAVDLQAVADDGPLRSAREPQPSRTFRWLRRNRRRLAVTGLVLASVAMVMGVIAWMTVRSRVERVRLENSVRSRIAAGRVAYDREDFVTAMAQFDSASQDAERRPGLEELFHQARRLYRQTAEAKAIRARADELFRRADALRSGLLVSSTDLGTVAADIKDALRPFFVYENRDWVSLPELTLLDDGRRIRLIGEVNEILFLSVWALDPPNDPTIARAGLTTCDLALRFASPPGPWRAMRARYASSLSPGASPERPAADPMAETSARACFEWALLSNLEGRRDWAIAWLERATQLEPDNFWYQFYLASNHERAGRLDQAREHYAAAVVLNPGSPWALYHHARLYRSSGAWRRALDELKRALRAADFEFPEAHLELGVVQQALGNLDEARSEYDRVLGLGESGPYARAARLNRAKLDFDLGLVERARQGYDRLLAEGPDDPAARLGRALLALRLGQPARAEADLTRLVQARPAARSVPGAGSTDFRGQALALRAMARLALGRPGEAEADAAEAFGRDPGPGRERLWNRTLVAAGRDRELSRLDDPEQVGLWPLSGPAFRAELRAAADRLGAASASAGARGETVPARLARSVLLAALGDQAAEAEAGRAVALAPASARARLVRARVRRALGDPAGALADVERGLEIEPDEPRLLVLRGRLKVERGQPAEGLIDLDHALRRQAGGSARAVRARALMALGRFEQAVDDWSLALVADPEDPRAYLGRARAFVRLRQFDQASADLEQAIDWAAGRPDLLVPMTLTYAACLPARPDRLPRVLSFARRALAPVLVP